MIDWVFVLLVAIVGAALVFDFLTGFHDAANSIATVVSTRVLPPGLAVIRDRNPQDIHIATWMILACYTAIAMGTLFGGWRIAKTMGSRITRLRPVGGFCAETAAALTLFANSHLGIPVSTTHTITGAIMGVGATQRLSAVRWGVATQIVWAWFLTIPCSAFVAALSFLLSGLFV